jgi:hypothetical protein
MREWTREELEEQIIGKMTAPYDSDKCEASGGAPAPFE